MFTSNRMPAKLKSAVCRRLIAGAMTAALAVSSFGFSASAQNLPLIRDAEIEGLMKLYTRPLFKAAGINPGAVSVHLIRDSRINAFVAGGQRIFIHTGLLSQSKTPNEVIGVLAHETAHIEGGHLARLGIQVDRISTAALVGALVGAAAVAGAAATGQHTAAQAGQGIMFGAQGLAQRSLMSYARAMESAADQAAVKYLDRTGQSSRGMLILFQKLANKSLASARYVDPYVLSHPMPLQRIRNLERLVKASKYYNRRDPDVLILRHQLMQAKLAGFLSSPQIVFRTYPKTNTSLPARYARAIAAFRVGDLKNAVPAIDGLIKTIPQNPYFWELKGQALFEGGRPAEAIAPLSQSAKMLPSNGLIRVMLAQAYLGVGGKANAKSALATLRVAQRSEGDKPLLYALKARAYAMLGNIPMAELETAESAIRRGKKDLAKEKAKRAAARLKRGSPQWIRARDILNYAGRKK